MELELTVINTGYLMSVEVELTVINTGYLMSVELELTVINSGYLEYFVISYLNYAGIDVSQLYYNNKNIYNIPLL